MKISVRPVEATDEGPWLALFRDYITFYEATVPEDVIALTWQRLLSRADNMMALVPADEAGRALGIAALVFHRSTWSPSWYCYLEDLFVAPAARGRGIGRAVIEEAYAHGEPRGDSSA